MTPVSDANELAVEMPSYGVRRVLAAVAADPEQQATKFKVIDVAAGFEPDVEGIQPGGARPDRLLHLRLLDPLSGRGRARGEAPAPGLHIVFGGPSARTAAFDLPRYPRTHTYPDAVVATEGEFVFREIARLPELTRAGFDTVRGFDLPVPAGGASRAAPAIARLDEISSPFQLGLMGSRLPTWRCSAVLRLPAGSANGGARVAAKTVFSPPTSTGELEAFARHGVPASFLVDAGLNLNAEAFRNLYEAADRIGLLKPINFLEAETHPTQVREEHLEFLSAMQASYLGVGVESIDP